MTTAYLEVLIADAFGILLFVSGWRAVKTDRTFWYQLTVVGLLGFLCPLAVLVVTHTHIRVSIS